MVAYKHVKQGTGQIFPETTPPTWIGTDGAVTCVAIYMKLAGQGHFVAHADCGAVVRNANDPNFAHVRDTLVQRLTTALGDYNDQVHTNIKSFSGGTDHAMKALKAGLSEWAGGHQVDFVAQDSFMINTNGEGLTSVKYRDTPEEVSGTLDMSVS